MNKTVKTQGKLALFINGEIRILKSISLCLQLEGAMYSNKQLKIKRHTFTRLWVNIYRENFNSLEHK